MKEKTVKKPNLMDKDFKYVHSSRQDLRATFARIRKQMKEAEAAKKPASNVKPLQATKGKKNG